MEKTLSALCELLEGELIGDGDTRIRGVNASYLAQDGELTFAENSKLLDQALESRAAVPVSSLSRPISKSCTPVIICITSTPSTRTVPSGHRRHSMRR